MIYERGFIAGIVSHHYTENSHGWTAISQITQVGQWFKATKPGKVMA